MKKCRKCQYEIRDNPKVCPNCGAPRPANEKWKERGFEYKSKTTIVGIPLLHISFKYGPYFRPIPAKGIISIGHVGIGLINISQVGVGVISLSQITIAFYALAQIAMAYSLIAQIGLYVNSGYGQMVWDIKELISNYRCEQVNNYIYRPPENVDDGLEVGTLDEVDIDSAILTEAVNTIYCGRYKEVHSILIFKNNRLVLEEYFKGHKYQWDASNYHGELVDWNREMPHPIMSCTKSFTSACIGIAIEKGFINNVHQSIFDYLPNHQHLKTNNREYITIEHLLTMTSGLVWDEWGAAHGTSANDIDMLYLDCDDPITCVLERPWSAEPGEKFTYNGGGMVILGEILKNATNMNIDEFSKKYLFKKLGVDSTQWTQFENGMFDAANSLRLTPRDMLKFGVTYLNGGMWNDKRIISSEWVVKSSKIYNQNKGIDIPMENSGKNGYAYLWWISELSHSGNKIKMFRANGWGGQSIMVFPEIDMVVVFTGGNYNANSSLYEIIEKWVFPAIE
jgi:CubicO group peptidase (beta-lactamase class C family)